MPHPRPATNADANAAETNTAATNAAGANTETAASPDATACGGNATRRFVFDRLLLASASPRRSHLLRELGLEGFAIHATDVEEFEDADACPQQMVRHNARLKAECASRLFPKSLVLGSDTTVALESEVLNKPADLDDARRMLRKLSGRTHTVYTGVCFISPQDDLYELHHITSAVTFNTLSDAQIDAYFRIVNPLDKAGAYGIQEGREQIIASLDGSLENVMGLPIQFLRQRWQQLGCWQRLQELHPASHHHA